MSQPHKIQGSYIHPQAIVDTKAVIGANVHIGPFCIVGPHVILKDDVKLISHVCVDGRTTIGERTTIYPFASIGHPPQDLKYNGEPSTLEIGCDNTIREYVTIQPGTQGGAMRTMVGDSCLLMVGVHIAHDCVVGNHVVMANYATLAGHVQVGDHVIIGGLSAIQQFVRVGVHAMIGGMSGIEKDVIPFALVIGERAHLHGPNLVGLRRFGYSKQDIQKIQNVYKELFRETDTPFTQRFQEQKNNLEKDPCTLVDVLFNFIEADTIRHFCMPKKTIL